MKKVLSIILNKGISDIFLVLSLVCCIVALVGYQQNGTNEFQPSLLKEVTNPLIVAIVLCAVLCVFGSKLGKFGVFLIVLYAFVEFIKSQANYIANVFVAIDGSSFSAGFLLTAISMVLAFAFALVSGILSKDEVELIKGKKEKEEVKDEVIQ